MKYIIMCGGKYSDQRNLRQLTRIGSETLVERTIRLLKDKGVNDIAISSNLKEFECFDVPVLHHKNSFVCCAEGEWLDCFYPMDEPVCYLFGDVLFSPDAINRIVNYEVKKVQFFASSPPFSSLYIKEHAEPFAFKVQDTQLFKNTIQKTKQYEQEGLFNRKPAISWELWQVLTGVRLNEIHYNSYYPINDYTCDIDGKEDLEKLLEKGVLHKWDIDI